MVNALTLVTLLFGLINDVLNYSKGLLITKLKVALWFQVSSSVNQERQSMDIK